jgi:cardiolipin synthase
MVGNWIITHVHLLAALFLALIYAISIYVGIKVITQTTRPSKALGYLLLLFFLPGIGLLVYMGLGENRRINKIYDRKLFRDLKRYEQVKMRLYQRTEDNIEHHHEEVAQQTGVIKMLLKDTLSPLSLHNEVYVLKNGEEKFPEVIKTLKEAKHHIHLEYYIFEDGIIGDEIKSILIEKARAGVQVRFIYDDFGSRDITRRWCESLKKEGIEVFPFYKIHFFANRLNYRNHRKIIVVDGEVGFIGGINVSDRYDNSIPEKRHPLYWRDTHLKIAGTSVSSLQYLFLSDWSFASGKEIEFHECFFPKVTVKNHTLVQIASSGPDSLHPTIMLATSSIIHNARNYLYFTTPYFIPNESVYDSLRSAALGGLDVRMMVPFHSDSWLTNKAASGYYEDLLNCGVKIYRYQKGFVHAKTLVSDDELAMVGSANMDVRSFELNFETNAIVYDSKVAIYLKEQFLQDMESCELLDLEVWRKRGWTMRFSESVARLMSGVL